ncbi:FAD dependent oxidoreductase [Emticicia oligotrophica DSM 17448]|uniref:FAD dependent oxidoreductase n=1 Tax=Emticicia oligotrophica (strain DSM 17448 / CIP 109782 / MTCC 6937 / GPTSA100-15) TaxID=929562 RepID=A0ABM5N2I2_EMTOG|nr:FAD-dependent oxidoreductase [Emticicia oligotrophica]AFK03515.1 FAD dependent oxidoreductase [Emticicia oligotrophica DSM 17448]
MKTRLLLIFCYFVILQINAQIIQNTGVLIIGGSTSGTMAGIQSARMGVKTIIVEETPWLGGMLTSAGVSAIDGNHHMPSGLWGEFREQIRNYYGGADKISTGWVSNTLFEPSVGQQVLRKMCAAEKNLSLIFNTKLIDIKEVNGGWQVKLSNGKIIQTKVIIDATELGDVAAKVGIKYDLGMDAQATYHERIAPEKANNVIQDLTYTAILKDYGINVDKTLPKPANYSASEFNCACKEFCNNPAAKRQNPCASLMTYAKLPNGKVLINWPISGNDYYANMVEMSENERQEAIKAAKEVTLRFVYFLQTELGFKNFGLADDEYPTTDKLPFIPYHRESRRIDGLVRMNLNHIENPFSQTQPLYRTGIAVGDYAIDHHHEKNPAAPDLHFVPVPSFNIPLGSLIPKQKANFIVAEKSISVSNLVNGASRLQPVVMQIGQAAGALAAYSVMNKVSPEKVSVRAIQKILLQSKVYLMPYFDVPLTHPNWEAIQQVGATGILKGVGQSVNWSNRTWFYPDSTISINEFLKGLKDFEPKFEYHGISEQKSISMSFAEFEAILSDFKHFLIQNKNTLARVIIEQNLSLDKKNKPISRSEIAVRLAGLIEKEVDFEGGFR